MLREFTDNAGTPWRVWDVTPNARPLSMRPKADAAASPYPALEFAAGWLCFESDLGKRRLAPIPADWETCDVERLEEYCSRAGFASRPTPGNDPPQIQT